MESLMMEAGRVAVWVMLFVGWCCFVWQQENGHCLHEVGILSLNDSPDIQFEVSFQHAFNVPISAVFFSCTTKSTWDISEGSKQVEDNEVCGKAA